MLLYLFFTLLIIFAVTTLVLLILLIINKVKKNGIKPYMISAIITFVLTIIFLVLTLFFHHINERNKKEMYPPRTVELKNGTYEVGKDLEPGHYTISSKNNKGYIEIKTAEDWSFEEEFGKDYGTEDKPTIPNITTYLTEGDKINLDKTELVTFEPKHQTYTNPISTGIWIVGKDVKPGKYKIHTTFRHDIGGNFKIYNKDGNLDKEFILAGKESDRTDDTEGTATLKSGQVLILNHMYSVSLDKE